MATFLQKIIKPSLKKLGLDQSLYRLYFAIRASYLNLTNQLKKRFTKTAVILTYHRVATVTHDPHLLCVTPSCFASHLQFLKENYQVVSLPELLLRLQNKNLSGKEAVITLDDGYQDNLSEALPLLEKYQLPATIFITTGFLGEVASLPWDREYSPTERAKFLSSEEISHLANNPLITIGAHTKTHPRLAKIAYQEQLAELTVSKATLQQITGRSIDLLAYPFGDVFDFTEETKQAASVAGFTAACTTIESLVTNRANLYHLPRINIRNYSLETFSQKIFHVT
jgi:peptidoglycan/xylan/chitin deacetylase (PgdA/CDA1 family)